MKLSVDSPKAVQAGDPRVGSSAADQGIQVTGWPSFLTPAREALLLGLITAIGAALRLHLLATRSMWIDEAASVNFASLGWRPFLKVLWSYQGNMAFYYFVLRGWIHLGDSEFAVRSLSVLFGVLTIPAVYLLAARLFNRATGLTAAALLAVHSFPIHWSQETRAYSLLILLLVLTTYALVVALESNQKLLYWMVFAVMAALCFYSHIFAIFVLAALALGIAFSKPFRIDLPIVVATAAVFAFLCEPMIAFVLVQRADQLGWLSRPSSAEIYEFLKLLTSQGGALLVVVYLALCVVPFLRRAGIPRYDKENWALRLFALWLVLLPLLTLLASPFHPLFYPRYMVICVPALVILAARGLIKLYDQAAATRWVSVITFILVISLSAWGTHQYFVNLLNETSDWRSAVSYILDHERPGDGAVFFIANAYCYKYYVHRAAEEHKLGDAPDVLYPTVPPQPVSSDEVRQVTSGRERIWLILHIDSINPKASAIIQSTLAEQYRLVEKREFPGEDLITVDLYRRTTAGR